jgi:cytochrome c
MRRGWTAALLALPALWAAADGALAQAAGDPAAGEDIYLDRCVSCHVAEGGGQGPSLTGVYGRKAASAPGFKYSAALKASGLTWTGAELDRFLTNPVGALPGTAMPIMVPDARQRANVIAYLAAHASGP